MDMHEELKQYLLSADSIPASDKRYTMGFCRKTGYINSLNETLIASVRETVYSGFGNANADICFVFDNRQVYDKNKDVLDQNIMSPYGISAWQAYITFIDKCQQDYALKYNLLVNELNAVKPEVLYIITDDSSRYDAVINEYGKLGIPLPCKYFHIPLSGCTDSGAGVQKLWKQLHFIINYNNIKP